MVTKIGST